MPTKCPICRSSETTHFQRVDAREVLICGECRHLFWATFPDERELEQFYTNDYGRTHHQLSLQADNVAYYESHLRELLAIHGSDDRGCVLVDFGCSYPTFLEVAHRRGFTAVIGVDWDERAREYGRARGFQMMTPVEFFRDVPAEQIDIVRFSHTLEHLIDPVQTLQDVVAKLKRAGTVYITQPSFPVFAARAAGQPLKDAVWPEHLHFFSPISLNRLAQAAGLRVGRFFTHQNASLVLDQCRPNLDLAYAERALSPMADLGEKSFGSDCNYPIYAGENSALYARRRVPAQVTTPSPRLVGVSDVSVGYGSPQIPRLMRSLARHYRCEALILEPDQTDKRPLDMTADGCTIQRVATTTHPHSELGRRQFVAAAARRINELRPDILVLFCTFTLPVLSRLRYKPRTTVYHSLESIPAYGPLDVELNHHLADKLDLVIFPEENRARLDGQRTGLLRRPLAIVYNVRNERVFEPSPIGGRSPRFLYTGTLNRDQTLAEYFLRPELGDIGIDLFGQTTGRDSDALRASLGSLSGSVRYHGYVPGATLDELRRQYAFSIVMWAPTNENQHFAAPNKFFDAIAEGIPPVAAPHPQCKQIIERYGCGILMDDWSFAAFHAALQRASVLFGTPHYERMVANCGRAVECELNWPAQFCKIKRLLPAA